MTRTTEERRKRADELIYGAMVTAFGAEAVFEEWVNIRKEDPETARFNDAIVDAMLAFSDEENAPAQMANETA